MSDSRFDRVEALSQFEMFRDLPPEALQTVQAIATRPIKRGTTLFRQGAVIQRLFLVKSGQISLVSKTEGKRELRRIIGPGGVLGRLVLALDAEQLGTAQAVTDVELIVIAVASLIPLKAQHPDWAEKFERTEIVGRLRADPYLAPLDESEIKWVADCVSVGRKPAGATLAVEDEVVDDIVIIRQGRVRLESKSLHRQRWVSACAVIGNQAILTGTRRKYSAIAESETRYCRLPKDDFFGIVERHPEVDWLREPIDVELFLQRAPLFKLFNERDIKYLAGYTMQVHFHSPGKLLTQAGKPDNYYRILAAGEAQKRHVNDVGVLLEPQLVMPGFSFGRSSLLEGAPAEIQVETRTPTHWLQIHRMDFLSFLHNHPEANARLRGGVEAKSHQLKSKDVVTLQRPGENILFRKRRHPIVLLRRLAGIIGLLLVYLVAIILFAKAQIAIPWILEIAPLLILALPVILWVVMDYLNDYFIVTSRRIVHEERVPLVYERQNAALVEKMQNYRLERNFIAKILGYGHLIISTAAEVGQIKFDYLAHPDQVADAISTAAKQAKSMMLVEEPGDRILRQLQEHLVLGAGEIVDERSLIEPPPLYVGAAGMKKGIIARLGTLRRHLSSDKTQSRDRLMWRKHWFGLLLSSFIPLLLTIIFIAFFLTSLFLSRGDVLPPAFRNVVLLGSLLFTIFSFGWLAWRWTDWRNDHYIVTDQFIERIAQKPLWFEEDRMKINLDRVENVEYRLPHFIAKIFNFGDVIIQTAATEGEIDFNFVPNPADVHANIFARIEAQKTKMMLQRSQKQDEDIIKWLAAYHKLTQKSGPKQ